MNKALFNEMVKPAKRDNNKLRSYLIVNPCLCKHVPNNPAVLMEKAQQLSNIFLNNINNSPILIIAFSETATAVGASCAYFIKNSNYVYYITTTREHYDNEDYIDFSEVHSHASSQRLYTKNLGNVINNVEHIVFIEDEITTGNTIINLYNDLKNKFDLNNKKIWTLSLINGMKQENLDNFKNHNITPYYLLKTDNEYIESIVNQVTENGDNYKCSIQNTDINIVEFKGYINPRFVCRYDDYYNYLINLYEKINIIKNNNTLILGTEECMFAGILMGYEKFDNSLIHATTRSPIVPSKDNDYPLFSRYELASFYEDNRKTFIYNLKEYDNIYIITDSINNKNGIHSLINALKLNNNKNINLIFMGEK